MATHTLREGLVAFGLLALLAANADAALVPRTFVASTGFDTDPCSLAQPCRSFLAAMAKTAADGEVIVLDWRATAL